MRRYTLGNLGLSIFLSIPLLIGSLSRAEAIPVTIDFSSGVYSSVSPGLDNFYTEDGFSIYTPDADHFDSGPNGPLTPVGRPFLVFHEGSANPVNNLITLDFGGAAFDFLSFDLLIDPTVINTTNPAMAVTASDGSTLNTTNGFIGTYTPGWTNVTWVTFDIITSSNCCNVNMDNLVLDNQIVASVPEPSVFDLLASGLVALIIFGGLSRRASRSVAPF
jgi:hypothetical protein